MHFVTVEELPDTQYASRNKLEEGLEKFMSMKTKYARIVFSKDEYSSSTACQVVMKRASIQYGFPVDVRLINGDVYLIRRDI